MSSCKDAQRSITDERKNNARQTTLIQLDRSRVENGISSHAFHVEMRSRESCLRVLEKYKATSRDITIRERVSEMYKRLAFSILAQCIVRCTLRKNGALVRGGNAYDLRDNNDGCHLHSADR